MAQKSRFLQAVPRRQGQRVRLGRWPGLARRQASRCETASFGAPFCTESDHCTNTGSGQIQRNVYVFKRETFPAGGGQYPKGTVVDFFEVPRVCDGCGDTQPVTPAAAEGDTVTAAADWQRYNNTDLACAGGENGTF